MKQRILSFFLALLTLFGLFSTAAFAADTPEAALVLSGIQLIVLLLRIRSSYTAVILMNQDSRA